MSLLTRLASREPVIVYIDDFHWADADSAMLLGELLRPPDAPPLLTIVCVRTEEIRSKPFLEAFLSSSIEHLTLRLDSMNAGESRALITSAIGRGTSVTQQDIQDISREADGNPFLLRRLALHAATRPSPRTPGQTFAEVLLEPIAALPPDARPFLRMLAICGRPMAPELVFEAVGRGTGDRTLLHRLRTTQFVRSSGSGEHVEVYHDRIRETIVASMTGEEQRRLHGLMAGAMLARRIDDPEALFRAPS